MKRIQNSFARGPSSFVGQESESRFCERCISAAPLPKVVYQERGAFQASNHVCLNSLGGRRLVPEIKALRRRKTSVDRQGISSSAKQNANTLRRAKVAVGLENIRQALAVLLFRERGPKRILGINNGHRPRISGQH